MSLNIKPTIVAESSLTRQLDLVSALRSFLNQVSEFKALRKFDALLYREAPKDAGRYFNKHYVDLAKTDFGYSITKRYGRTEFRFYRLKDRQGVELTFDITETTIPAISDGLNAYHAKLVDWHKTENEVDAYECGIEREIENQFNREHTAIQFENRKRVVADMLRRLADDVENT